VCELGDDMAPDEAAAACYEHSAAPKIAAIATARESSGCFFGPRASSSIAHFIGVSARAVAGSSLDVACQLTVGIIA
jgi:hypothetical protein